MNIFKYWYTHGNLVDLKGRFNTLPKNKVRVVNFMAKLNRIGYPSHLVDAAGLVYLKRIAGEK